MNVDLEMHHEEEFILSWLHLMVFLPFIFAFVVPFLYKGFNKKIHTGWFVILVPLTIFTYFCTFFPEISSGEVIIATLPWIPTYHIDLIFLLDGLSYVFTLLIVGIGSLVVLYSIYYLNKEREQLHNFYVYLLIFMGAMLGLVVSDNIFTLYVFWEITSISSFLLIAYWYQRERSRYGAQKSMLITISGGLAMLSGLVMLSIATGTNSIREIVNNYSDLSDHSLFIPAIILILLGAFTKSAQFPFSIWLPDAMEAPTPISAYLHSATMVKAGIYLVARLTPVFGVSEVWFWLVLSVGFITLFYGSINAVRQTDLKALLAYSTVSQLGLIMSLLGIGSAALHYEMVDDRTVYALAIFTAIFHLFNHSTFKGSLFMVVGIIDHETGTRDIRRLGGLMQIMPASFTLTVIGAFSMAGLPPFNGFLSKEMFFTAVLSIAEGDFSFGTLIPVIAWIASVFTFIYCMILVFKTFAGKYKLGKNMGSVHEAPIGMLISPSILAILVILIFFFPNILSEKLLIPAWQAILPTFADEGLLTVHVTFWHGFTKELWMTIGVILLGTFMYVYIRKWYRLYDYYPERIALNYLYNLSLEGSERFSRKLTNAYMTGFIRDYLVYIFAFIIFVVGGALVIFGDVTFQVAYDSPITLFEVTIIVLSIVAAVTVLLSNSRITSVIAVGALGFFVAFFFVLFRAPDLALTQLVVETVTTALFLLCFYHLPELRKEMGKLKFKLTNVLISIGMGVTVTLVALAANGNRIFESISSFYEDSYSLAGAKNIVNAILVDFRGFDTMLEILVLTMAGLGVYILIKLRLEGRESDEKIE